MVNILGCGTEFTAQKQATLFSSLSQMAYSNQRTRKQSEKSISRMIAITVAAAVAVVVVILANSFLLSKK